MVSLAFSEIHPDYYQIPKADRDALLEAEAEALKLDAELAAKAEAAAKKAKAAKPKKQKLPRHKLMKVFLRKLKLSRMKHIR